ncbi:hypothetical protein VTJ83DRAFT_3793 [Remersonia thermophila]|uniref:Uncharacterized protein n=1 Tax=Remersonia thermophila TaxID=72144 RepID=A0ABR4DFA1_9PEZI
MTADLVAFMDCTGLEAFRNFGTYLDEVRSRTSFNETLQQCRVPICGALWGYGVPDISGIGVAIGYTLSNFLGPLLSLLLLLTPFLRLSRRSKAALQTILTAALAAFFDAAVYFALAIAAATTVVLVPKDWAPAGSPRAFFVGDYDARAAALASAATVLPLVYPVAVLSFAPRSIVRFPSDGGPRPQGQDHQLQGRGWGLGQQQQPRVREDGPRTIVRKALFAVSVIASAYPFLSHSVRVWAPAEIGSDGGDGGGDGGVPKPTMEEWKALSRLCFGDGEGAGVEWLTERESSVLGAAHLASSVLVLLFALGLLVRSVLHRVCFYPPYDGRPREDGSDAEGQEEQHEEDQGAARRTRRGNIRDGPPRDEGVAMMIAVRGAFAACWRPPAVFAVLAVPMCLAAPLLWGFWRLRTFQMQLTRATGESYEGDDWGFGQIMAVTVFVPVLVEVVSQTARVRVYS